jgi:hypothetical protein
MNIIVRVYRICRLIYLNVVLHLSYSFIYLNNHFQKMDLDCPYLTFCGTYKQANNHFILRVTVDQSWESLNVAIFWAGGSTIYLNNHFQQMDLNCPYLFFVAYIKKS